MKKGLIFLAVVTSLCILNTKLKAQSLEQRLNQSRPSCADVFANAMDVLPELYKNNAFDSMQFVIDFVEKNCGKIYESFDLKLLLAIQRQAFKVEDHFDSISINNLASRAAGLGYYRTYRYGNQPERTIFYDFSTQWAKDLLKRKNLDLNETLILKTLAGEEKAPINVIRKHKSDYPYLYQLLRSADETERSSQQGVISLLAGAWIPTNNLTLLGSHPALGLQFGTRNKLNELDLTVQFRFINSANQYTIMRQNTLYPSTHFFGGYAGLDYIRYLLHGTDVELGWLAGAGYDGFDVATSENGDKDYLKPLSIGSFNLNTGLRFNYFLKSRASVGLIMRYNMVNYKNTGGTSFKGDSFSFDIVVGLNGQRSKYYH